VSRDPERAWIDADYPLLVDQVRKTYQFHATPGLRIPTGWESIDPYLLGGPAPGEVVYFLGRSHTGKSMFLLNIIRNNPDVPTILFTLEMPYHQAITRLTAMAMNLSDDVVMRNLSHGTLAWEANPLLDYATWVIDTTGLSLNDMADVVTKIRHDYDPDLHPRAVLIDYLELIRSPSKDSGYERTETLARDLKAWSKRMELPVFVAHQSNMTIKRWEPPDEGAARGAGYTEADAVIGVWHPASDPSRNPTPEQERIFKARIIKNRIAGKLSSELEFQLDNALLLWDPVAVDRLRLPLL
jgi:replicative DNA helicase